MCIYILAIFCCLVLCISIGGKNPSFVYFCLVSVNIYCKKFSALRNHFAKLKCHYEYNFYPVFIIFLFMSTNPQSKIKNCMSKIYFFFLLIYFQSKNGIFWNLIFCILLYLFSVLSGKMWWYCTCACWRSLNFSFIQFCC